MLVTRILLELDAQLERLQTARDTIASLIAPTPEKRRRASRRPPAQSKSIAEAVAAHTLQNVEARQDVSSAVTAEPATRRGRPKGSVNRQPSARRARVRLPSEPSALVRSVKTGPVFVSAAELEKRRAQTLVMSAPKPVNPPVAAEGTLDALIREVAERRTSAAA